MYPKQRLPAVCLFSQILTGRPVDNALIVPAVPQGLLHNNENLWSANPVKNWAKRSTVIHYILTENEQEKLLTCTVIESLLTSTCISPSIWHVYRPFQAQSNHTIIRRKKKIKLNISTEFFFLLKLKQQWSNGRLHKSMRYISHKKNMYSSRHTEWLGTTPST